MDGVGYACGGRLGRACCGTHAACYSGSETLNRIGWVLHIDAEIPYLLDGRKWNWEHAATWQLLHWVGTTHRRSRRVWCYEHGVQLHSSFADTCPMCCVPMRLHPPICRVSSPPGGLAPTLWCAARWDAALHCASSTAEMQEPICFPCLCAVAMHTDRDTERTNLLLSERGRDLVHFRTKGFNEATNERTNVLANERMRTLMKERTHDGTFERANRRTCKRPTSPASE